ncbi:MAG: PAS domain S-box protein [Lacunisphaera sp.]|nr:PAS domain S-box protein [Lacunisphaera sp.]
MPSRNSLKLTVALLVVWTLVFAGLVIWSGSQPDPVPSDRAVPGSHSRVHAHRELIAQGLLWLLGAAGIVTSYILLRRLGAKREQVVVTLRKSRHDLCSVLGSIDDLVFAVDAAGRVEPVAGLAGLARVFPHTDQVAGRPLAELLPAAAPRLQAALAALAATGQTQEIDFTLETGDRVTYWNARLSRRLFGADASPGAIVVMRDLTRRGRAETALRDSEEKWRLVYERANEGIVISHLDGTYVAANRAACEMLGLTEAELLARGRELIAEPSRSEFQALLAQRENHGVARGKLQLRRKDGTLIDAEGSTSIIHPGDGQPRAVTIFHDVTARQHAEAKALNYALRWETALEAMGDGLWDWDKRTDKVFLSPGWKTMRGYTNDEIGDTTDEWSSRVHPDDLPAVQAALAAHQRGETSLCVSEYRIRCKDGSYKWILDRSRVIERDAQGAPVRMVGMHRDMTEPRRAQEALQAAMKQLEHAQRVARLGSYTMDLTSDHWTSSPVLDDLFGIKQPGFVRDTAGWLGLVHPDDREAVRRYFAEEVVGAGRRFDREYRLIRPDDGRERWVHGLGELTLDAAGRPLQMFGTIQDVTERKQTLAALVESEQRFRSLVEDLPNIAVQGYDSERRVIFWNSASAALYGFSREEALGRRLEELIIPPVMREGVITAVNRWLAHGEAIPSGELVLQRKDGSPVTVFSSHVMLRKFTGEQEMHCIDIDLTERKAAEARMREHAQLLDVTQDAIFVLNLDRVVLFMNRSAEALFGLTAAQAAGRRYEEIVYRELPPNFEPDWRHLIDTGAVMRERRQRKSTGEEITMQLRATVLRDEHARPRSVLVVATDITEARRLEAQYLRAQRLESLGSLASGVAHDLNNVLTPILVAVDLLRPLAREPQDRDIVQLVSDSARRGADIVQQLLLFGRGSDTPRAPVDVGAVLGDLRRMMQETFPKNIALGVQSPPGLWPVEADRTQLHQVLLNLAVNARDAMPQGGELQVTAENVQVDGLFAQDHIGAKPGPHVAMRVADSGPGIPTENLEKIFDPFFTTKPTGQGTGLGLATVLGITRSHGGFVTVDTPPGGGATFTIYLPATATPALAAAGAGRRPAFDGRGELVLLVDDELAVRNVLKETLAAAGYRTLTATNGAEALDAFARHPGEVRLVISDQMMPVMDGRQLLLALRALDGKLPALLMSGMGNPHLSAGHGLGRSVRFLPKPFLADALLRAVRESIDEAGDPRHPA